MSLIKKVQGHCRGQKTSGQSTLALLVECIDHMFGDSKDWSPLAYLIGRSEPAQSRVTRKLVGKVVMGYRLTRDEDQPSGLRFSKSKDKNHGLDEDGMKLLRKAVADKLSIQSKAVVNMFDPETKPEVEFDPKAWAARQIKARKDDLSEIDAMIAALQVQRKELAAQQKKSIVV